MLDFFLSFSCMLTVIQNEAKGENFYGKVAVGEVLRNRSLMSGKSICYEAKKENQFAYSPAISQTNYPSTETTRAVWNVLRNRSSILPTSTIYFCNPRGIDWPTNYLSGTKFEGSIGNHAFYSKG